MCHVLFRLKKYLKNNSRINLLNNFYSINKQGKSLYRIYLNKNNCNIDNCLYDSINDTIIEYNHIANKLSSRSLYNNRQFINCLLYYDKPNYRVTIIINQDLDYSIEITKYNTITNKESRSILNKSFKIEK